MGNAAMKRRDGYGLGFLSAAAIAVFLGVCGSVGAFEIKTGSDDVYMSWDNTLRYTYGHRVQGQNQTILNSPNFDDGDRNLDVGTIMNRFDILSELGLVYKKDYGIHVSGAGWRDQRYYDHLDNTSVSTSNFINANGQQAIGLTRQTKDQSRLGAELLDAFVFGNFDAGGVPVSVKVGRSTVYWGEGLLNAMHSISYSQMPLDFAKATAQPGVEVKEVFRPLNNVTVTIQPFETLTLGAQYFLQWEEDKLSETGSYFGAFDFALRGGQSLILAPGFSIAQGGIIEPRQARDFGFMARWTPNWLAGTLGLYYRNFSDKLPQAGLLLNGGVPDKYFWSYASGINLYGMSFGKQIAGGSFGAEISYRTHMPLNSSMGVVTSPSALPGTGDTFGARGNTWHALANYLTILGGSPLWNSATAMAEVDYSRVECVTERPDLYLGRGDYSGIDKPSRDYLEATVAFTPTWYQVFPGVDMTLPLSFGSGLIGTSGVSNGGNRNAGSYSFGIGADIFQKYKADLKYAGYFGSFETDPASGGIKTSTGYGFIRDRGFISLTLKTTF